MILPSALAGCFQTVYKHESSIYISDIDVKSLKIILFYFEPYLQTKLQMKLENWLIWNKWTIASGPSEEFEGKCIYFWILTHIVVELFFNFRTGYFMGTICEGLLNKIFVERKHVKKRCLL